VRTEGFSYRFTDAVMRRPGSSVVHGLRASDRGTPNVDRFLAEHKSCLQALEREGLFVEVLPADEAFPDSVFIEDAALCLPEGTVVLRPGAPSRTGEVDGLATALKALGHDIHHLDTDGFVDGGDILVTDSFILVGLSSRSDQAGYDSLAALLNGWGYEVRAVHTPENVLHFKSDCCLLDSETILATSRLAGAKCIAPFRVLTVPQGEEAAANAIRINDTVLISSGFPATAELLDRHGYRIREVPTSQAALLDGGLSCMSLRFGSP
jgi:dimethylargininase